MRHRVLQQEAEFPDRRVPALLGEHERLGSAPTAKSVFARRELRRHRETVVRHEPGDNTLGVELKEDGLCGCSRAVDGRPASQPSPTTREWLERVQYRLLRVSRDAAVPKASE